MIEIPLLGRRVGQGWVELSTEDDVIVRGLTCNYCRVNRFFTIILLQNVVSFFDESLPAVLYGYDFLL